MTTQPEICKKCFCDYKSDRIIIKLKKDKSGRWIQTSSTNNETVSKSKLELFASWPLA